MTRKIRHLISTHVLHFEASVIIRTFLKSHTKPVAASKSPKQKDSGEGYLCAVNVMHCSQFMKKNMSKLSRIHCYNIAHITLVLRIKISIYLQMDHSVETWLTFNYKIITTNSLKCISITY